MFGKSRTFLALLRIFIVTLKVFLFSAISDRPVYVEPSSWTYTLKIDLIFGEMFKYPVIRCMKLQWFVVAIFLYDPLVKEKGLDVSFPDNVRRWRWWRDAGINLLQNGVWRYWISDTKTHKFTDIWCFIYICV